MTIQTPFGRVDFEELGRLKHWLIEQEKGPHPAPAGLLNFIDAIQDWLVDDMGFDERDVFPYLAEAET